MPPLFQHVITLIARIMISLYFIVLGGVSIAAWSSRADAIYDKLYFLYGTLGEGATLMVAHVLLVLAIVVSLIGGISILIGLRARAGAVLLIVFLVPATIIIHNFWAIDGPARYEEISLFLKNIALLGGLMMILAFGSGGMSADLMVPRRREMGEF